MRKKYLIGNWKMNHTINETKEFCQKAYEEKFVSKAKKKKLILGIAPSYISLQTAKKYAHGLIILAQDCHNELSGAFTSSISIPMLEEIKVNWSIIGHSERRQYQGETDLVCNNKIKALVSHNFNVVFCVGESEDEYEKGLTKDVISTQVLSGLRGLKSEELAKIIIAYEPVWSIGTGKNASKEIAQDICSYIRKLIAKEFNKASANKLPILYGGSVKPNNINDYLNQKDVDGALVGGASLKIDSFNELIENYKIN